jgi:hypothetical protein
LHARAIQRLRAALDPSRSAARPMGAPMQRAPVITALTPRVPMAARPVLPFARPVMAKALLPACSTESGPVHVGANVLPYSRTSRADLNKSAILNGLASQRQPVSSKKRAASMPTTSPVTKITRRASDGFAAAMAR